jgi:hypothetical protein
MADQTIAAKIPTAQMRWVDRYRKKRELTRSAVVRLALRRLKEDEESVEKGAART